MTRSDTTSVKREEREEGEGEGRTVGMKKKRKKEKMVRPIDKRVNGMEDSLRVKRDGISLFRGTIVSLSQF